LSLPTFGFHLKVAYNRLVHALAVTALWLIHVAVWALCITYGRIAQWELRCLYNVESMER
jgi:hypothetical protein